MIVGFLMGEHQNFVISGYHIEKLLKHDPGRMRISLDLGITDSEVTKTRSGILLPDGQAIKLELLESAHKKRHLEDCFLIEDGSLIFLYSFRDNMTYKLYEPHADWPPTLSINGSVMHTVSVSKPNEEARSKVRALGRISGKVLDTCFGLGYVSIELAGKGADVSAFELSEDVIELARANPWSRRAFEDKRIRVENLDVYEAIRGIGDSEFDSVLHDPPNVKIAGDLYSLSFYRELYRVLKPGGTVYHFVGGGRIPREHRVDYMRGVVNRLSEAGFKAVRKSYRGAVAVK
jgi:hypothetical protein